MPASITTQNVEVYDEEGNLLFICDEYTARSILARRAAEFIRDAEGPKLRARRRELYDGPEQGIGWLLGSHWPSPFDVIADEQRRSILDRCLGCLPHANRTLMMLRYRRDLKFRQIAMVLEVSEEAVIQMHQRTLLTLRSALAQERITKLDHIL